MKRTVYITTAIPYVNARPHVGFALELVQADVVARYSRLIGNSTRLQTGTDENAFKNVLAARKAGVDTQQFVDGNSALFEQLARRLDISFDDFVRTTESRHRRGVELLWKSLRPEDVYVRDYSGLYCAGCEDFYQEKDLVGGLCPDHGVPPQQVNEANYFFRLSAYQQQLKELVQADVIKVVPQTRKNEVLAFIGRGLQDISISRPAERAGGWGIPVPEDDSQVVYVWIDALVNYISGLGYGTKASWREFWNDESHKVHVIGKNVWKFHAIYWPALLLSAGLPLPDEIVVHGFITEKGQKISKSLGATLDPIELAGRFGADALRYFLLKAIPPFDDGDFSLERLGRVCNEDLANGLGNLLSRLCRLCEQSGFRALGVQEPLPAPEGYREAIERYEFDRALASLWRIVTSLNHRINDERPWELTGEHNDLLHTKLTTWLTELYQLAYWLAPLLPDASRRVIAHLSQSPIRAVQPLFARIT